MHDHTKVLYVFFDAATKKQVEFTLPTSDELFHGIKGFEATLGHFFYLLSHLAQQQNSQPIITKISAYFLELESKEKLIDHLNEIFSKLFSHMEIDFQRGLPLSFYYISSIQFNENKILTMSSVKQFLNDGNINQLQMVFSQFPELIKYPHCIAELLCFTSAYSVDHVSKLIESLSPEGYLTYQHKLHEIYKKKYVESKHHINQLAATPQISLHFNLCEVLQQIKNELSKNNYDDFRKILINENKSNVEKLCTIIKSMYKNVSFAGGDSKLRQVLMDFRILHAMTGDNHSLLLAIFAYEIDSQKQRKRYCPETYICTMTSQATGEKKIVSLGEIIFHGFAQPAEFFESIPINEKYQDSIQQSLQRYIKQKIFTAHAFKIWEDTCTTLYRKVKNDPNISVDQLSTQYPSKHSFKYDDLINTDRLAALCKYINDDEFCSNSEIVDQVNDGLISFLKEVFPQYEINHDIESIIILPSITLNQLVDKILCSTAILIPWPIAHLLFDRLHFGVALTNTDVYTIEYSNKKEPITFYQLINLMIKTLSSDYSNALNTYPLMYEQLSLRMAMLDDWCIKNDKYPPPDDRKKISI
jgi:hypothetical protein